MSVDIGNTVTNIGSSVFYNCTNLTSLTIPDSVTSIGDEAFTICIGLTSVTIPNSVTSIEDYAFQGCSGFTSVTIPDSVESIGADVFYECSSVIDVYCYPNPANLTWNEDGCDDFKSDGSTVCHVKAKWLAAYETKFGTIVNVTFAGDLA